MSHKGTFILESIGRQYYEHRQALMLDMQLMLTESYNLFHDPGIASAATDLSALETQLTKSGAKTGVSEAIPRIQALREILKRLLELNHRYHAEEEEATAQEEKPKQKDGRKRTAHGPELGL